MKKLLIGVVLSVLSLSAMAGTCTFDIADLSKEQAQQLKVTCEQMRLDSQKASKVEEAPVVTKENLTEWAQIAQEFAKALGVAAREVGVSVNEFLPTTAGILTAIILIWMTMGKSILAILVGLLFTFIAYKLNQRLWYDRTEEIETTFLFKFKRIKRVARYNNFSNMDSGALVLCAASIIALAIYWGVLVAHI